MSSSLLLVLIVVVWLFVLAPLVVNTRQPIRRTSEALGRTRLLHQGGESVATRRRSPTLSERDVRVAADDSDAALETVDAEFDEPRDAAASRNDDDAILIDDTIDERPTGPAPVVEGDVVYELEAPADPPVVDAPLDDAPAAPAADPIPADDAAVVGDDAAIAAREPGDDFTAAALRRDDRRARAMAASAPDDARTYLSPEDFLVVDEPQAPAQAQELVPERAVPVDESEFGDDERAATQAQTQAQTPAPAQAPAPTALAREHGDIVDDDLTEDDLAFAERRRGRGGFDPVSDARYTETRFARRRRSVAMLAAVIVVGVAIGVLVGGWTWWVPLVGTGLLALYLVYLRRTVIAENDLRARRIRRMKMARLGVRNSEDEELGVPERLRRPGAVVVELDDEDPDFADLPYTTYEYPEEGVRRAAGQ